MLKNFELSHRAESLNIYKPRNTLQLPRFHSRPKNAEQQKRIDTKNDSDQSSKASKKKGAAQLSKAHVQQIVNKIKDKKNSMRQKTQKLCSQKKITAQNNQIVNLDFEPDSQLFKNRLNEYRSANSRNMSEQIGTKAQHRRKMTTQKPANSKNEKNSQFRSKSLKNAIKLQESINHHGLQIKNSNKNHCQIDLRKKIPTESQLQKSPLHRSSKRIVECSTELTEQTQQNSMREFYWSTWKKVLQFLKSISLEPNNLDWPENYIVMEKRAAQKKLLQIADENVKLRDKIKKLICIARVCVYLNAGLILNSIDAKILSPIFERMHETFTIILEGTSNALLCFSHDRMVVVNRNAEQNVKFLSNLLSKRTIPHSSLLKNMLESSLKIQSDQFIEILDKTLKWQILKMPSYPYLPSTQKQLFLVLDLDETLIHYDHVSQIFHVRPFAEEFLKKVSSLFQITIFTAAVQEYADQILDQIDPDHNISYKLYRNHLTYLDEVPIKDLSMLGRPLNKTIIVDNIACNYRLQPENGIQIRSWYDDDNDEVLGKLYALLIKISQNYKDDIRNGLRDLHDFVREEITRPELIYELKKQL